MAERCSKYNQRTFSDRINNDYKKPLIKELVAVIASYPRARDGEEYMERQGRAYGLLMAIFAMDHQGLFPDKEELSDMEGRIRKKIKGEITDWLISQEPFNWFVWEGGKNGE